LTSITRVFDLHAELGASPMSSLGIVSDSVTSLETDPLWQWSVLLLLLTQDFLGFEGFVGWL
jgi:hypothetical protein